MDKKNDTDYWRDGRHPDRLCRQCGHPLNFHDQDACWYGDFMARPTCPCKHRVTRNY